MLWAGVALSAMALAACGDDKDDTKATTGGTTAPAATAAADTAAPEAVSADLTDYCAVATEIYEQEDFPTADQMTRYQELAPPEVSDAANTAVDAMVPVAGDPVLLFNAFADDKVAAAMDELEAFEAVSCGLDAEDEAEASGSSTEIEPDATRVDVVAKDYEFEVTPTLAAGRTSFVLTNHGTEAHFLLVSKLKDGVPMDEALAMEDPSGVIEGEWESGLAVADGTDEEVITLDLVPGKYALLCFVPNADGTPHAFMGMATEVTVS
jgi:hypothetical protein